MKEYKNNYYIFVVWWIVLARLSSVPSIFSSPFLLWTFLSSLVSSPTFWSFCSLLPWRLPTSRTRSTMCLNIHPWSRPFLLLFLFLQRMFPKRSFSSSSRSIFHLILFTQIRYNTMRSLPQLFSSLLTILETSSVWSVLASYPLDSLLCSHFLHLDSDSQRDFIEPVLDSSTRSDSYHLGYSIQIYL